MMMFLFPARQLLRGLGAALLSAGLLAACGGSTSRVDQFNPERLIVLGDEMSALVDRDNNGNGYNFAMNGLNSGDTTNSTIACNLTTQSIWVQRLASSFGLVFKECNPSALSEDRLQAYMLAKYGATVRTLQPQVDAFQANIVHDALNSKDLITVLVGVNDIVEIYKDNLSYSAEGEKIAEAQNRGAQVGALVNQLAGLGPRVLVSQIFDVGLSPWALLQGSAEAKTMTAMSDAFNTGLRLALINDGTKIGLLSLNDIVANLNRYGGYNTSDLACNEDHVETINGVDADADGYLDGGDALGTCTTATVTSDTAATKSLWADGLRLIAPLAHAQLGSAAISRAVNNPF